MAYQNVGTPRFYIDIPTYLNSIGTGYSTSGLDNNMLGLDPEIMKSIGTVNDFEIDLDFDLHIILPASWKKLGYAKQSYFGILNHNFANYQASIDFFGSAILNKGSDIVLNADQVEPLTISNEG